jgi:hypothetical protein
MPTICAFLDGTMQLAVRNVFDHHDDDFAFDRLRLSFVGGFTSPNRRDHQFNLQVGFGTKTFAQGAEPERLRFLIGGTTGFCIRTSMTARARTDLARAPNRRSAAEPDPALALSP